MDRKMFSFENMPHILQQIQASIVMYFKLYADCRNKSNDTLRIVRISNKHINCDIFLNKLNQRCRMRLLYKSKLPVMRAVKKKIYVCIYIMM